MALTCGSIYCLGLLALFLHTVVAPPPKGFFVGDGEPTTSTQLSLEEENERHSIWDEDEDVFDLDGDSWLKQPPSNPLSTWPTSNQKPSELDDDNEDNMIDDEDDDSDDDRYGDGDPSEFLLIPEAKTDGDKRDMKVRHTGHYPENDVAKADVSERSLEDTDASSEANDDDVLVSFPEAKDEDFNDDNDGNLDDDLFGDQDEDDSKKLFEDRVFLF